MLPEEIEESVSKINALLDEGQFDSALVFADETLQKRPDSRPVLIKRGVILRALQNHDAAFAHLSTLAKQFPDDLAIKCELAASCRSLDNLDGALKLYRAVLRKKKDHPGALLGVVSTHLAQADPAAALRAAKRAGKLLPPDNRALQMGQCKALRALGRFDEALVLLNIQSVATPEDLTLRLELARANHDAHQYGAALDAFSIVLNATPDHPGALVGQINSLLASGQFSQAEKATYNALGHLPDDEKLLIKRAVALRAVGRSGDAIAHLQAALDRCPESVEIRHALAQTYRSISNFDAAIALGQEVLISDPNHQAALIGQVDALIAKGDYKTALSLLKSRPKAEIKTGQHWLRSLEIHLGLSDTQAVSASLDLADSYMDQLNEKQLWRLYSISEKATRTDIGLGALKTMMSRPELPYDVALYVVRRLQSVGQDTVVAQAVTQLRPKLSAAERDTFDLEAAFICNGPLEALKLARARKIRSRTQPMALQLARLLSDAGAAQLATRYLRFCNRRWPASYPLVAATVRTYLDAGMPEAALASLRDKQHRASSPDGKYKELYSEIFVELGQLDKIYHNKDKEFDNLTYDKFLKRQLNLEIHYGNLDRARRAFDELARNPVSSQKFAHHKSISLEGAQITELELYHQERALRAQTDPQADTAQPSPNDVFRYTYPAKTVIKHYMDRHRHGPGLGGGIPPRIAQYWDSSDIPPDIAQLTKKWHDQAGIETVLFDRKQAMAFLQETLGPEWAQAFALARKPAEESDLFRLCYLMVHGGIYVDADDMYLRDFSSLIETSGGLLVFCEPFGTVENNFIAARADHPAIRLAAHAARDALLRRESEITWQKTGPGLLTRILACFILANTNPDVTTQITILPRYRLRPYIRIHMPLAYKKTRKYWNAASRVASSEFEAMVKEALLAPPPERTTRPKRKKQAARKT